MRTLSNAVEQGKVHHAYLFVGSRGTGKTSMAKILASCLNCEQGPTITPCGVCDSCRSIATATSLDVVEMDAASNNSVDDIRDLRESVAYAPVSGRQKVYILDEAHMLSTAAWNAFLKTLEEPPPNTVFVLATTEAQKVLPTVVDRCHRFDFARPSADQIISVLQRAATEEKIELPDAAAALIARHATGSFRDALGTLEQLTTYGGSTVAVQDVLAVLGIADGELLFAAVDAVAAGDVRAALITVARLSESGRDPGRFFSDLEGHARELLVVGAIGEVPASLRLTEERDRRLGEQAARVGRAEVVRLLDLLAAGMEAMKAGSEPRTQLELALIKAAAPDVDPSREALLTRIERLEAQVTGGGGAPAAPVTPAAPADGEPLDFERFAAIWPSVIETIRADNAMLAALFEAARPLGVSGDEVNLGFAQSASFLKRKAEDRPNRDAVIAAIAALTGHRLTVTFTLVDDPSTEATGSGGVSVGPLSADDWFERFITEFDGEEISLNNEEEVTP